MLPFTDLQGATVST